MVSERRKRAEPSPRVVRTPEELEATREADRRGLWVLVEDDSGGRRWTVYSRATGMLLLTWWPGGGGWLGCGKHGRCRDWRDVVKAAARLARTFAAES